VLRVRWKACVGCSGDWVALVGLGVAEVLVLIDFEGTAGDEMTVRTGDLVKKVTKSSEEGWLEGELGGRRGIFPANFAKVTSTSAIFRVLL